MPSCATDTAREVLCRDGKAASHLKLISIFIIFFTSVLGISLPILLARLFQGKPAYDKAVLIIKCFAAGVILSTSLVHVLPDAFTALADCQVSSLHPWKDFPFSGLVTLIGVLLALSVDLSATSHVHNQQQHDDDDVDDDDDHVTSAFDGGNEYKHVGIIYDCHETGAKELRHQQQQHDDDDDGFDLPESMTIVDVGNNCHNKNERLEKLGVEEEEEMVKLKQRLVSQVLEIGIIFHSVIIGVTMGMSQNKCTIRPLVAALAFHQIFEGMGLGGCIAQAGFSLGTTAYMCFMFSVTTPMGIILGMVVFSVTGYDDHSRNALIIEGLLGSLSSGILIYMALVDLIALDFFHNKLMGSEAILKKASFVALVLGSTSMSILALWA